MIKPTLTIIIVSFNTKELLVNCLDSLLKVYSEIPFEVIISDNGSTDGSIVEVSNKKYTKLNLKIIENKENLGFAKGNNVGKQYAKGKYVLFLNPDTIVSENTLKESVKYLDEHKKVGAFTCKVLLQNGLLDPDTRRRFPTPFIALSHFSYLDRLFPNSLFDKYWYHDISDDNVHEVEALQGAFFLARRDVLDSVNWFDEDYFLDGEDIDLSFKIHEKGFGIVYFPHVSIIHIKKGSKSKNRSLRSVVGGVYAMELFYKKRMWSKYPILINFLVLIGINVMKYLRIINYYISK